MQYNTITFEVKERIASVTINRPTKLNALNAEVLNELKDVFDKIANDANIGAVIVTGSGEKAFVAGADIAQFLELNAESGKKLSEDGQWVFNFIDLLNKPVIAAVNGYALGGGCELAMACHLRIASENAKFGQPEVNLGLIPGWGGTQRLPRLVGRGKALEMILTGDAIDAQEALRIGLVNKVVPLAELLPTAETIAKKMISKAPFGIRLGIIAANAVCEMSMEQGLALEADLFGSCCDTEDQKEGTKAFLEKRAPVFKNA
jgi:enoyl-CoA hydratase